MGSVGKHVDDTGAGAAVTRLMHKNLRIARECGGIAANVNDASGRLPWRRPLPIPARLDRRGAGRLVWLPQRRQGIHKCESAFPRRVDEPLVCNA